jgi:hypothetical protein
MLVIFTLLVPTVVKKTENKMLTERIKEHITKMTNPVHYTKWKCGTWGEGEK